MMLCPSLTAPWLQVNSPATPLPGFPDQAVLEVRAHLPPWAGHRNCLQADLSPTAAVGHAPVRQPRAEPRGLLRGHANYQRCAQRAPVLRQRHKACSAQANALLCSQQKFDWRIK